MLFISPSFIPAAALKPQDSVNSHNLGSSEEEKSKGCYKNIAKVENCPEVAISNFVQDESHGLGLFLGVAHGVSHVVGNRVSVEACFGTLMGLVLGSVMGLVMGSVILPTPYNGFSLEGLRSQNSLCVKILKKHSPPQG